MKNTHNLLKTLRIFIVLLAIFAAVGCVEEEEKPTPTPVPVPSKCYETLDALHNLGVYTPYVAKISCLAFKGSSYLPTTAQDVIYARDNRDHLAKTKPVQTRDGQGPFYDTRNSSLNPGNIYYAFPDRNTGVQFKSGINGNLTIIFYAPGYRDMSFRLIITSNDGEKQIMSDEIIVAHYAGTSNWDYDMNDYFPNNYNPGKTWEVDFMMIARDNNDYNTPADEGVNIIKIRDGEVASGNPVFTFTR